MATLKNAITMPKRVLGAVKHKTKPQENNNNNSNAKYAYTSKIIIRRGKGRATRRK